MPVQCAAFSDQPEQRSGWKHPSEVPISGFAESWRKKEYYYLENLLQLIKKKREKVTYALTKIETIDIDIDFSDMKCCKCSTIIGDDSFLYYCYICKTKYCINCVNNQLKNDGKDKYIDQKHNLVFFKTRNKQNLIDLDKIKFGIFIFI